MSFAVAALDARMSKLESKWTRERIDLFKLIEAQSVALQAQASQNDLLQAEMRSIRRLIERQSSPSRAASSAQPSVEPSTSATTSPAQHSTAEQQPSTAEQQPSTHKQQPTEDQTKEGSTQEQTCLLYTSPSPRDRTRSRMPSSA
eukprot:TRINITY_DN35596_c0_g1_i1.p1 TRINITY_DN35596_c0_g1~~TRINITY_DN35596_c0_g1_i1.p1  ORF type:complete len:145 (+),score=53.28 TRINITY_DN35596_c0_g1_i1:189-623(+)